MSDPNVSGARSLFGLRKRAPKRPVSVTIILAIVLAFLFLSGPRQLTQDSAVLQARAFAMSEVAAQCGAVTDAVVGAVSRIPTEPEKLERYDVAQIVWLASGKDVPVLVQVWPGIRIGPRVPIGSGNGFVLFEFQDGAELVDNELRC